MGKKRRRDKDLFYGDHFWQSSSYNFRTFNKCLDMLLSLAINRFRWENLPETCDARYLEKTLHRTGIATLSHKKDDVKPVYTTLQAMPNGQYNMYGLPVKWRAVGYDGQTDYEVDNTNGELCYYSYSRTSPWNALEIYARRLAHYERTEEINLTHQMKPFIGIAPQEKKLELVNLLKQVEGGEPAILGDEHMLDLVNKVTVIDTQVPLITEDLARSYQNVLNQALMYLGIPHLAFEKGERMIEDEARANTSPTNIMLLDCLQARRDFCKKVNKKFNLNIAVYFNEDLESYNFNYLNNIEQHSQDGYSGGGLDISKNYNIYSKNKQTLNTNTKKDDKEYDYDYE